MPRLLMRVTRVAEMEKESFSFCGQLENTCLSRAG